MERKNQTQPKKYSKWRTYQAGKHPIYDQRLNLRIEQSGVLNKNPDGLTIDELQEDLIDVTNNLEAANEMIEKINGDAKRIKARLINKEALPKEVAEEKVWTITGEQLLLWTAERDRFTAEKDFLQEQIEKKEKAQEQKEKQRVLLRYGPQYDIKSRAIKDKFNEVLSYEIIQVDGQSVSQLDGIRFIDDKESPYDGMLLDDYHRFCKQYIQQRKGNRSKSVNWRDLPAFPSWARKHQTVVEEEKEKG